MENKHICISKAGDLENITMPKIDFLKYASILTDLALYENITRQAKEMYINTGAIDLTELSENADLIAKAENIVGDVNEWYEVGEVKGVAFTYTAIMVVPVLVSADLLKLVSAKKKLKHFLSDCFTLGGSDRENVNMLLEEFYLCYPRYYIHKYGVRKALADWLQGMGGNNIISLPYYDDDIRAIVEKCGFTPVVDYANDWFQLVADCLIWMRNAEE